MTDNVINYTIMIHPHNTHFLPLINIWWCIIMIINDIDIMKQKLYNAIEKGDDYSIYEISVELDSLIVEFYKIFKI